jgi:hypothetical protein
VLLTAEEAAAEEKNVAEICETNPMLVVERITPSYRIRRCFAALNSKITIAPRSVTPPLKSAQTRKMFSVGVIAPSPRQVIGLQPSRERHCGRTRAAESDVDYWC